MKGMRQLSRHWGLYWETSSKYFNWTPSVATIHDGQALPIGVSLRFLMFAVAFVYVR